MDDGTPARVVERDDGPEVRSLDELLRPPDRLDRWRSLLARVREVDRRILIGAACLVLLVAGVVAVMASRSSAASTGAEVSLPRAQPDHGDTGGGASTASNDSTSQGGGTAAGVTTTSSSTGPLVVDVAGAVLRPGLVSVPSGSRVADAVTAAGGFRPDADSERVNLASPLNDGVRVYVPAVGQSSIPVPVGPNSGGGGGSAAGADGSTGTTVPAPVDLNSATADQLDALPGVGPSTAQAILAYRAAHGSFGSVDDLDQVRGIGPAKLAQLRDLVVVG